MVSFGKINVEVHLGSSRRVSMPWNMEVCVQETLKGWIHEHRGHNGSCEYR